MALLTTGDYAQSLVKTQLAGSQAVHLANKQGGADDSISLCRFHSKTFFFPQRYNSHLSNALTVLMREAKAHRKKSQLLVLCQKERARVKAVTLVPGIAAPFPTRGL